MHLHRWLPLTWVTMTPIPDIHTADNPSASLSSCAGSVNVRSAGWGAIGGVCQCLVVGVGGKTVHWKGGLYEWGVSKGGKGRREQACLMCCVPQVWGQTHTAPEACMLQFDTKEGDAAAKYAYVKWGFMISLSVEVYGYEWWTLSFTGWCWTQMQWCSWSLWWWIIWGYCPGYEGKKNVSHIFERKRKQKEVYKE